MQLPGDRATRQPLFLQTCLLMNTPLLAGGRLQLFECFRYQFLPFLLCLVMSLYELKKYISKYYVSRLFRQSVFPRTNVILVTTKILLKIALLFW